MAVDQMNEAQQEADKQDEEKQENCEFMAQCRRAFVDSILGDSLFESLFEKDRDGAKLSLLASVVEMLEQYPLTNSFKQSPS